MLLLPALELKEPILSAAAPSISVVAIVNPLDGRTWNASGRVIACPLTREERQRAIEALTYDESSGSLLRLILFRTQPLAPPQAGVLARGHGMPFNGGHFLSMSFGRTLPFAIAGARIYSTKRPLTVDASYSTGPAKTVLDFLYRDGKITVRRGADRRPRLVLGGADGTRVSFDYKPGDYDNKAGGGRFTDANGKLLFMGGTRGVHKRTHEYIYEPLKTPSARFVYSFSPTATRRFVVPMRPSSGVPKVNR